MLPKIRKSLLLQTAIIALFSLAGFLILFYVVLQAVADPRVLKRMLGFDSFAGFLLTSGGGILAVILLAGLLFTLVKRIFFSRSIKGEGDALHRILVRLEQGDLSLDKNEMDALPLVIRNDIAALRDSLLARFERVRHSMNELEEVSRNLQHMSVNSSLRISFLNAQLETMNSTLEQIQSNINEIHIPAVKQVQHVLIAGEGSTASSLISALTGEYPGQQIFQTHSRGQTDPRATFLPTERLDDFLALSTSDSNSLVFLTSHHALAPEDCSRLLANGVLLFGFGSRVSTLDSAVLNALLVRYHIPVLPWKEISTADDGLAFAAAHKGPWRIEARRLQSDRSTLFPSLTELADFLSAHPGIFGDTLPVKLICGDRGREYSVLALSDRTTLSILGCAELNIAAGDNDTGPETHGIGAFTPSFLENDPVMRRIRTLILGRLHGALRREGVVWHGFVTLRIYVSTDDHPFVLDISFGLISPECDAILAASRGFLVPACLAALRDELESFEPASQAQNAIAIVFSGTGDIPTAPPGTTVIPYSSDDERTFSLVSSRRTMEETIHSAYLSALPVIRSGQFSCRQDVGGRTLLAHTTRKQKHLRIPGSSRIRRMYEWLLGTWSKGSRRTKR